MKCSNPYFRFIEGVKNPVPCPCGSCIACRKKKASEWSLRLEFEARSYPVDQIWFVTFTYDPQHVPDDYSLDVSHVQKLLKRIRLRLPYKIRYYICGEYGDERGRPHYHAIFFGLKQCDLKYLGIPKKDYLAGVRPISRNGGYNVAWSYGFVDVEVPRSHGAVCSYIAQYVMKKIGTNNWGKRLPPFHRQSQGLGLKFALENIPSYTPVLQIGKYFRSLGRYLNLKLAEKFNCLAFVKLRALEMLQSITEVYQHMHSSDILRSYLDLVCGSYSSYSSARCAVDYSKYCTYYRGEFLNQERLYQLNTLNSPRKDL